MIRFLQTRGKLQKYLLGGILTFICVMMAITLIPGFGNSSFLAGSAATPGVVATVSGEEVRSADVQRQARQMLEQQFPRGGPQASSLLPFFAQRAAEALIGEKILVKEAERMGLRATDDDAREYMRQGQLGQTLFPGGTFVGQEAYQDFVTRIGYTVPQFEQLLKQEILVNKLRDLVVATVTVTDAEVRRQFEKQNTKIRFDYAVLKQETIAKGIHPADAELKAYYERNKNAYVNSIPEKRQLKYVVISKSKLLVETQVTREDLESYYNQHRDEYRVPEQVNVRHILIKSPLPGADGKVDAKALEAARTKAEDVLKQVKSGANFAELAKKYSEDSGSAKSGGSLGWIGRGRTVAEFEKVAFSLPTGATSDLVKSSYGFHIIHVDDKQDAHLKTLDEVKAQIEPLIRQQKVAQAAERQADQLVSDARSSSLDAAARTKGLQVISTDFVTHTDVLPGIGSDPQFMSAAFAQNLNAPPEQAQLHDGFAVYQVTAVKPPSTPGFEEIRGRVEQEFKNERAAQLLRQKTQELSDRAKAEHDLRKAAKELEAEMKTSDWVAPDGQVPDLGSMTGPAAVAFSLKPGETSGPIDAGNTGVVLTVLERQAPSEQGFALKKDQIREALVERKAGEVFSVFLGDLQQSMEKSGQVKINQKELQALTKTRTEESD